LKYAKDYRLLTPEEFRYVFEKPKKISGEAIDFYIRKNHKAHARLGMAVPKRALKSAVMRNRVKRQLREQFRLSAGSLGSYDIIAMVKPGMIRFPVCEYAGVVARHWQWFLTQCDISA
jgi:ribonuclease P protein component